MVACRKAMRVAGAHKQNALPADLRRKTAAATDTPRDRWNNHRINAADKTASSAIPGAIWRDQSWIPGRPCSGTTPAARLPGVGTNSSPSLNNFTRPQTDEGSSRTVGTKGFYQPLPVQLEGLGRKD